MPRSRQIKPDFFINEELAELSVESRLLFIGLWIIADREGRLEDRPLRIKAQIFPYNDLDVDSILDSLSPKFIHRYISNTSNTSDISDRIGCIQIVNFTKHQHIHPDEKVSILPKENRESPEIPGNNKKSRGIMPCSSSSSSSPSSSNSPSPKQPLKSLSAVDFSEMRFPYGKHKGAFISNLPVDECQLYLKDSRIGKDLRVALEARVSAKTEDMTANQRKIHKEKS
jgi:hypothetical protein